MSAIVADQLSKHYRIGLRDEQSDTLFGALANWIASPLTNWRRIRRLSQNDANDVHSIWALRDVSFSVERGEVVGIVGANGAGKSTLLKILSRITDPTHGQARLEGRVSSLLEVGTGFHNELTGRENVYLNGSLLGMSRTEIDAKFDAIVAFAEVEPFIDTPVKRYSSGMKVRLAFAVSAFLEPEILLVDEVLAVGDLAFQRKCLGKMGDAAESGRTVLLVSHQMNQIRRLCPRCLWFDRGRLRQDGPTEEVVAAYEAAMQTDRHTLVAGHANQRAAFLNWEIVTPRGQTPHQLASLDPVTLRIRLRVYEPLRRCHHGISIRNADGVRVWGWSARDFDLTPGDHDLIYQLPMLPLQPGAYTAIASLLDDDGFVDKWTWIPDLVVTMPPMTHHMDRWAGVMNVPCDFEAHLCEPADASDSHG